MLACSSRQARRLVSPPAAGIDAASMARRCQNPFMNRRSDFLRMLSGSPPCTGVVSRATLRSEVKEEARRRPPGDMSGEQSPESPRLTQRAPQIGDEPDSCLSASPG